MELQETIPGAPGVDTRADQATIRHSQDMLDKQVDRIAVDLVAAVVEVQLEQERLVVMARSAELAAAAAGAVAMEWLAERAQGELVV